MVRFKNRHILLEFLTPSALSPNLSQSRPQDLPSIPPSTDYKDQEDDDEDDEGDGQLVPIPTLPFLIPLTPRPKLGDEPTLTIYRAIRNLVQEVFGDEGWGRVASSFKVIYHSPLTTLTIIRISRQHYRLLWASITLLTHLGGVRVIPRVIGVSGTIKKLQNRAVGYHRVVIGQMVGAGLGGEMEEEGEREVGEIMGLEDR